MIVATVGTSVVSFYQIKSWLHLLGSPENGVSVVESTSQVLG